MKNWNDRVIQRQSESGEPEFGIYEVFYFDDARVKGWIKEPLFPCCFLGGIEGGT